MKIFGIGMHKTGTKTLAACLKHLGYNHLDWNHYRALELTRAAMRGDTSGIFETANRFDSFEDWPWPLVFKELDQQFPDSKFILTTRIDSETWWKSLQGHALTTGPSEFRRILYGHDSPGDYRLEHVTVYEAHNTSVRNYFAGGHPRFLDICWERGHGWKELCEFLGHPVPDLPLPHFNQRAAMGVGHKELNQPGEPL